MERLEADDIQSFGGWVESRRRLMNLTRVELAEKVGCAVVTLKKIERDERRPSRQMAELLAEHLLVPRAEREAFLRMARGAYVSRAGSPQLLLRIPPFLQQDHAAASPAALEFVERRRELSRLQASLDQALAGRAAPVCLLGEAGSGKTSLMREFARLAQQAQPELLVAGGQCNAQTGQGDAFRPFRDILATLTGDLEPDWAAGALNREQGLRLWSSIPDVLQAIADLGPHLLDTLLPVAPLVHRISPYLGGDVSWFDRFQAAADQAAARPAALEQGQVLEELTQVLRALAARHPLLLVLDDLQWVDNASLNVLFHLGRRLAGSRILILGACRTGETPAAPARPASSDEIFTIQDLILEFARQYGDVQLRLDQTSPAEGRAFIDAILDQEPNRLGEAFREDLYLRTRGQPLFTVELLRSMRQNGNLVLDEAAYWVEDRSAPASQRPARVEAVIEQRLARLEPLHRQLLDIASVQGEGFIAEVVARVSGLDFPPALQSLTQDLGQRHHLVQEQGPLSVRSVRLNRFQFRHMLVQEHLYGQLDPAEKRRLHRRVAEELEKILREPQSGDVSPDARQLILPEYLDAFGPALLHHLLAGEDWARAADYASALGARARQQYAMREAIRYYEQALRALEQTPQPRDELVFDALLGWEDAAFSFTPYEPQLAQLSRAEGIARRLDDGPRLIRALHWTANVLLARGLWTQAGPVLAESLALAEQIGDEGLSVRPLYFKALMTSFADPSQALHWTALARDLSHKHADANTEALALATEGQVLAELGDFAAACLALEAARQISDRTASPILGSDVDLFSAWAWLSMGDWEQALQFGERSVNTAIATDNMDCICSGMVCLGYTNLELGRMAEAASAFEKGIERSVASGAKIPKQNGEAGLAMTRFMGGHPEAADELATIIRDMQLLGNHVGAAAANRLLGACLVQLGQLEQASQALEQAIGFYRQAQMHPSLGRSLLSMAELLDRQGRQAEAQACRAESERVRVRPQG